MPNFGMSQRTTATAAASADWEIRSASANRPRIKEMAVNQNTGTAGVYGIGRPAAIGITPTTPQTWLDEEDGGAGTGLTQSALAWGTGPTVPANFFRRITCPATVGAGLIETFPRGLGLPVSNSVVLWIIATAPVCDVWGSAEE